ncbi:MAG: glycosyltransferase [Candidatus Nitrospinota bacterium M3_3B_026]
MEKEGFMHPAFVIISGGARPASLRRLVRSIVSQDVPRRQIIVVGEHEDSLPVGVTFIPAADLAARAEICRMRNIGIDASEGGPVILLDDDVEFPPGWYADIRERLSRPFDLLTCRVLLPTGERWYDWSWASREDPLCPPRMLGYSEKSENVYISGCMMIIARRVFEKVRFDENLMNHQRDDVDFCHRAVSAGFDIDVFTGAYVIHHLEPAGRSAADPASGTADFSRAVYLYRLGRLAEALEIFDALGESDRVKAPYHGALCLIGLGRGAEAEKRLNIAVENADLADVEQRRIYYRAHYRLGALLEGEWRLGEAAASYRKALEGMPEHHEAAMGLHRLAGGAAAK